MITDTDRINYMQSVMDKGGGIVKIEKIHSTKHNPYPFKLKMFTIETQHFYGDDIRNIIDTAIRGEQEDYTYYGAVWNSRTKEAKR